MKLTIGRSVKFVLLVLLIAGGIAFCFRPVRAVVCENANICVYSCEEYSGKPIDVKVGPIGTPPATCEEREAIRNRILIEGILNTLHLKQSRECPPNTVCIGE